MMMRRLLLAYGILLLACNKAVDVKLPDFESQVVVEMYLEHQGPLRCFVSETVAYTATEINKAIDDVTVILETESTIDTLIAEENHDYETGRVYNYLNRRRLALDSSKTYKLKVERGGKVLTASTRMTQSPVVLNSLDKKQDASTGKYSIGVRIEDPATTKDYYRFIITKKLNDFYSDPTDEIINDLSFNGKNFSIYSNPAFNKKDTLLVRVYSLTEDHYNFLRSAKEARRSNFSTFSQPALLKSNVVGGTGIFAAIRYTEQKVVIE